MEKQGNTIIVQTERKWGLFLLLLVFVVGAACGAYVTGKYFHNAEVIEEKADTVFVPETLEIPAPPVTKYIKLPYAWLIPVKDTLRERDTLYMYLDKEVKEYRDSNFFARVSGYQPSLDYIEVYPKKMIITNTLSVAPKKNFVSLGINAGYLNTFTIPIYLEYERKLHKNISAHARLLYDLPGKSFGAELGASVNLGW